VGFQVSGNSKRGKKKGRGGGREKRGKKGKDAPTYSYIFLLYSSRCGPHSPPERPVKG